MKPNEIFQTFEVFKTVMDGAVIPQEMKLKMAQEFKHSLPPVSFSTGCPSTRQWLEDAVQAKIDLLQAEEQNGKRIPPDSKAKGKAKEVLQK